MKLVLEFEIQGKIPSKKNAWKRGKGGRVFIASKLRGELDALTYSLISIRNKTCLECPLNGSVRVEAVFYGKSFRADLDNAYTTLQDLLQGARIIKNDRQIESFSVTRIKEGENRTKVKVYSI